MISESEDVQMNIQTIDSTVASVFSSVADRIAAAVENTKQLVTSPKHANYWESTCAQRAGANPEAAGSVYDGLSTDEVAWTILQVNDWEVFIHPDLMPGTTAFVTKKAMPGRNGIVELSSIEDSVDVILDDRKGTGTVSATIKGIRGELVGHTVIILGDNDGKEVVFTFHPGDPVKPSSVKLEPDMHGKKISAKEARDMGLTTAKIV